LTVKLGTIISIVPDDPDAMIVVELQGEVEPISVAHNLREIRARNLKRGDLVSIEFDELHQPTGIVF
jgi:hypothetical protein